nr:PREDICTED: zinc finger CCCH domain-containing protein 4-like isoform X2 [Latimeria chalumnae]|eukprot:XP_006011281.1 PREDICTED: zinc finger CCCH domain-containing protein 4-like isoform X2 [Latimeria chalumnae]
MTLRTVFGTAGPIYGIRMLYDRYCAFVNFGSKEAAEKAFDTLQGLEVDGTKLVLQLKHPDHAAKTAGGLKPTAAATAVPAPAPPASNREKVKIPSTLECHFWRNKGCVYGDTCRFLHSPENRGIDQTPSSK